MKTNVQLPLTNGCYKRQTCLFFLMKEDESFLLGGPMLIKLKAVKKCVKMVKKWLAPDLPI